MAETAEKTERTEQTEVATGQAGESGLTIDELARETGLTARNIRAYQSRGLIPPPEVRSRTGYYSPEHVTRLRLIRDMQAQGFNLKAIARLFELTAANNPEALRFGQDLLSAFGGVQTELATAEELVERFGPVEPALIRKAVKQGALRPLDDGTFEVTNPTLLRAAEQLVELGIPLHHAIAVGEAIAEHVRAISKEFVRLFLQDVMRPLEERADATDEEWAHAREALERLRPLASEAVLAALNQAMATAVEHEVVRRAGR